MDKPKYVKLTHTEHILKRPDTYIGSTNNDMRDIFIVEDINNIQDTKIILKNINYNPGFMKLFDEVIVNASDYSIKTNKVTYIKVTITQDYISVENDGPGISIDIHKEENVYTPELIFGHLLTSDNYNDDEDRYTGGRNGLGVKLCNIYSKKFILETADGKKQYTQEFKDNLSIIEKPSIKKSSKNFVKVTYYPDFERFGLTKMDEDTIAMMVRRVFDIAAYNPSVKVSFNDTIINIKSFKDYVKRFSNTDDIMCEKINDNWEIAVIKSPSELFNQTSMVNGISTLVGGTHVNHISNTLLNSIKEQLERGIKGVNIRTNDIKNRIHLFVNCKLPNPTFDTQTKENLTLKLNSALIKDVKISDTFIKKLSKLEMFADLVELSLMKEKLEAQKELNKQTSKRIKIDKLFDANNAGKDKKSKDCYLYITEGLSANALTSVGFSVIGRNNNGSYPVRGKLLNVNSLPIKKVSENEEIKDIIQILGLEVGKKYDSVDSLRYGQIVIMTDADCVDGDSLIKTKRGLVKIKDITYDDYVLTHNGVYKRVINIIETHKKGVVEVTINNQTVKYSKEHKLIVYRNNQITKIKASELLNSDKLLIKK